MQKQQFTVEEQQQLAMERTPRGYVWHHGAVPGNMQLVETHTHRQTGHDTGYCNWPKMSEEEKKQELSEAAQDYESRPREPVMWGFVEPLQDPSLIRAYERQEWVRFPKEFKELVASVNGAYPSREEFITEQGTVTDLKCLLSFNRDSSNSIWVMPDYDNKKLRKQYSVFAEDSNGNYICFQKNNLNIVWIDHETENVEKVAPDFGSFLNMLF